MKVLKKNYLYLLLATSIAFFGGCEEEFSLDLEPISSLADGSYWKEPSHGESFMNGIHSRLRTHQHNLLVLGEYRADIYDEFPFTGNTQIWIETHLNQIREESPGISNFGGFYTNINQVNLIIDKTLDMGDAILRPADKNYYLGQACWLREFYYFHLLRYNTCNSHRAIPVGLLG